MIKVITLFLFIALIVFILLNTKTDKNLSFTYYPPVDSLQIYVIHYTPLKDRKAFLLNELNKHSLNYRFIEDHDREKLSDMDLKLFDKAKLTLGEISIFKKNIQAWEQIVNSQHKYNLIFEDDVILDNDFNEKLEKGLEQLPADYDMLSIGSCCNLHITRSQIKSGKLIYNKGKEQASRGETGATRCTDSYLVSQKCAKKIIRYISNLKEREIRLPVDHWLNKVIIDLQLEIYWMEPTIVIQGTESGKYKSSH